MSVKPKSEAKTKPDAKPKKAGPRISVVIPTVTGREDHLARCIDAYEAHSPADTEIIVIKDEPGCGAAWVKGAAEARGEFLHFTADDLEPHPGWWQPALEAARAGVLPAACVYGPHGGLESAGLSDTALLRDPTDRREVQASGVPFLAVEVYERAIQAQELSKLHYSTDLLISEWARRDGLRVEVRTGYAFTHHWAAAKRLADRLEADFRRYRELIG